MPVPSMPVNAPVLRRTIAWFCLAVALLLSVAPRQGFVLCVETDGCLSVAPSLASEHCDGCEPHELALDARGSHAEGSSGLEHEFAVGATEALTTDSNEPCPCLDVEVPGAAEGERLRARTGAELATFVLDVAARVLGPELEPPCMRGLACEDASPRPRESLAHVASVVLLV